MQPGFSSITFPITPAYPLAGIEPDRNEADQEDEHGADLNDKTRRGDTGRACDKNNPNFAVSALDMIRKMRIIQLMDTR